MGTPTVLTGDGLVVRLSHRYLTLPYLSLPLAGPAFSGPFSAARALLHPLRPPAFVARFVVSSELDLNSSEAKAT